MTNNSLPKDKHGNIITSADFGISYMVCKEYNTDEQGEIIVTAREDVPKTYHGPFGTAEEAIEWLNAYPDDEDVTEMYVVVLNKVRP